MLGLTAGFASGPTGFFRWRTAFPARSCSSIWIRTP